MCRCSVVCLAVLGWLIIQFVVTTFPSRCHPSLFFQTTIFGESSVRKCLREDDIQVQRRPVPLSMSPTPSTPLGCTVAHLQHSFRSFFSLESISQRETFARWRYATCVFSSSTSHTLSFSFDFVTQFFFFASCSLLFARCSLCVAIRACSVTVSLFPRCYDFSVLFFTYFLLAFMNFLLALRLFLQPFPRVADDYANKGSLAGATRKR